MCRCVKPRPRTRATALPICSDTVPCGVTCPPPESVPNNSPNSTAAAASMPASTSNSEPSGHSARNTECAMTPRASGCEEVLIQRSERGPPGALVSERSSSALGSRGATRRICR